MSWLELIKSFAEVVKLLAITAFWVGMVIAVIRDGIPRHTFEGRIIHGGLFVAGVAIFVGFLAEHVK